MAKNISFGFIPQTLEPIDSRYIKVTGNPWDANAFTIYNAYEGMQVYSQGTNKLYVLTTPVTAANLILEASWLEITAHGGNATKIDTTTLNKVLSETNATISAVDATEDAFVYWNDTNNDWDYANAGEAKTLLSLDNVENTALSTWAGSTNITTVGTIGNGTWNGTDVAIAHGGTGASDALTARTNLGFTGAITPFISNNATSSRAIITDGNGKLAVSAVTSTELGYISGLAGDINDQFVHEPGTPPTGTQFLRTTQINDSPVNSWHALNLVDIVDNPFTIIGAPNNAVRSDEPNFEIYNQITSGEVGAYKFLGDTSDTVEAITYGKISADVVDATNTSVDGSIKISIPVNQDVTNASSTLTEVVAIHSGTSIVDSALQINNTTNTQQKSLQVKGGDVDFANDAGVVFATESYTGGGLENTTIGEHVFITGSQIVLDDIDDSQTDITVDNIATELGANNIGFYQGTGTDYTATGDIDNLLSDGVYSNITQVRANGTASAMLIGNATFNDDVFIYISNPSNNNHGLFFKGTVTNVGSGDTPVTVVTIDYSFHSGQIAARGTSFVADASDVSYIVRVDFANNITGLGYAHYVNDDTDYEYGLIKVEGKNTNAIDKKGLIKLSVANDTITPGNVGQVAKDIGTNGASITLDAGDIALDGALKLTGIGAATDGDHLILDDDGNVSRGTISGGGGGGGSDQVITFEVPDGTDGLIVGDTNTFALNSANPVTIEYRLATELEAFQTALADGDHYLKSTSPTFKFSGVGASPFDFHLDYNPGDTFDPLADGSILSKLQFEGANLLYAAIQAQIVDFGDTLPANARGRLNFNVADGAADPSTIVTMDSDLVEMFSPLKVPTYGFGPQDPKATSTGKGTLIYTSGNNSLSKLSKIQGADPVENPAEWERLWDEGSLPSGDVDNLAQLRTGFPADAPASSTVSYMPTVTADADSNYTFNWQTGLTADAVDKGINVFDSPDNIGGGLDYGEELIGGTDAWIFNNATNTNLGSVIDLRSSNEVEGGTHIGHIHFSDNLPGTTTEAIWAGIHVEVFDGANSGNALLVGDRQDSKIFIRGAWSGLTDDEPKDFLTLKGDVSEMDTALTVRNLLDAKDTISSFKVERTQGGVSGTEFEVTKTGIKVGSGTNELTDTLIGQIIPAAEPSVATDTVDDFILRVTDVGDTQTYAWATANAKLQTRSSVGTFSDADSITFTDGEFAFAKGSGANTLGLADIIKGNRTFDLDPTHQFIIQKSASEQLVVISGTDMKINEALDITDDSVKLSGLSGTGNVVSVGTGGVLSRANAVTSYSDEGTDVTGITKVNFVGSGVTASANGTDATQLDVSINAGSFGGILTNTSLSILDNAVTPDGELGFGIDLYGENDNSDDVVYAALRATVNDDANTAEDGGLILRSKYAGSDKDIITINGSSQSFTDSLDFDPLGLLDIRDSGDDIHILMSDEGILIKEDTTKDQSFGFWTDTSNASQAPRKTGYFTSDHIVLENKDTVADSVVASSIEVGITGTLAQTDFTSLRIQDTTGIVGSSGSHNINRIDFQHVNGGSGIGASDKGKIDFHVSSNSAAAISNTPTFSIAHDVITSKKDVHVEDSTPKVILDHSTTVVVDATLGSTEFRGTDGTDYKTFAELKATAESLTDGSLTVEVTQGTSAIPVAKFEAGKTLVEMYSTILNSASLNTSNALFDSVTEGSVDTTERSTLQYFMNGTIYYRVFGVAADDYDEQFWVYTGDNSLPNLDINDNHRVVATKNYTS